MSLRPIPSLLCGVGLLLAFALAPAVFPSPFFRTAMGDLIPLLVIAAACIPSARNACDSRGHTRLFWSLMTMGLVMWGFNQAMWVWVEVVVRKPLPDPFAGDIVLFLHVVPIMAAVALQPHQAEEREGLLPSTLNVLMVLVWWVVVYAFFVFPDEYLITNVPVYTVRWDVLYAIEGLMLIGVSAWAFFTSSGAWRELYRNIFFASSSLHDLLGKHECRDRTRHVPDRRNLRSSVPRRVAGFSLDRHRRSTPSSRYPSQHPGGSRERACQPLGRSSTCQACPDSLCPAWPIGRCS